jgi:hypothetical protein
LAGKEIKGMAQITLESLAKRVKALEQKLSRLTKSRQGDEPIKDWRKAVGQFRATEFSREVDEAGRRIREADRRKTTS